MIRWQLTAATMFAERTLQTFGRQLASAAANLRRGGLQTADQAAHGGDECFAYCGAERSFKDTGGDDGIWRDRRFH
jgi:hypothetical protein